MLIRIRHCLIYVMPPYPPHDPHYIWKMTMNGLREQVNKVIDVCMVDGESGWPPHSGGTTDIARSKAPWFCITPIYMMTPS